MSPTSPVLPLPAHPHPTQLQCWPGEPAQGSPRPPQGRRRRGQWDARGPDGHGGAEPGSHLAQGGPGHLYRAENCSGEKQRAEGTAPRAQHRAGGQAPDIHYTAGPRTSTRGRTAARESQRSRNKGGCCLIHSKDDFLKLVQPQEQRTEPPVWLRVQGKVQQGRGFMCCPGDSRGLAQAGTQLTARPSGQEEQRWCLTVSDLRVSERERERESGRKASSLCSFQGSDPQG